MASATFPVVLYRVGGDPHGPDWQRARIRVCCIGVIRDQQHFPAALTRHLDLPDSRVLRITNHMRRLNDCAHFQPEGQ